VPPPPCCCPPSCVPAAAACCCSVGFASQRRGSCGRCTAARCCLCLCRGQKRRNECPVYGSASPGPCTAPAQRGSTAKQYSVSGMLQVTRQYYWAVLLPVPVPGSHRGECVPSVRECLARALYGTCRGSTAFVACCMSANLVVVVLPPAAACACAWVGKGGVCAQCARVLRQSFVWHLQGAAASLACC
jgi:hypothetical protein